MRTLEQTLRMSHYRDRFDLRAHGAMQ